jgi:hypothetical protein
MVNLGHGRSDAGWPAPDVGAGPGLRLYLSDSTFIFH